MGVFSRIFKVGQAHANQLVDRLEDPAVMLEQAIKDKEKEISEARKAVMEVIATEKQTRAELSKEEENKTHWEERAKKALKLENENLAAEALKRSEEHEQKAARLREIWENQRTGSEQLKAEVRKLSDELAEYKRNKDFLIAQAKTAAVKKKIYEAKAKIGRNGADDLMARMQGKIERLNYQADAAREIEQTGGDSLEKQFEALDSSEGEVSESVREKLEKLKKEL